MNIFLVFLCRFIMIFHLIFTSYILPFIIFPVYFFNKDFFITKCIIKFLYKITFDFGEYIFVKMHNIKFTVNNAENLKKIKGSVIFACKHSSTLDFPLFNILKKIRNRKISAIARLSMSLQIPIFIMTRMKDEVIFLDDVIKKNNFLITFRKAFSLTKDNSFDILIFPEGGREGYYSDIETTNKSGIYLLYKMLKIPIVPVATNFKEVFGFNHLLHDFKSNSKNAVVEIMDAIEYNKNENEENFMSNLNNAIIKRSKNL